MEVTQLLGIFVTGLFAGGLSCMAVQGGLLAATVAQRQDTLTAEAKQGVVLPIIIFLIAKLIVYTFLGLLLGWLGSTLQFSLTVQIILQVLVSIFMFGTAMHLLKVHPIFRYFLIQPPHFISKRIRKETKSKNIFAPAILGAFTVFIPCGTTQAMMALSVASGDPFSGAVILFAFVLGTSPLFFLLGYFTSRATSSAVSTFTKFAAILLLSFALFNTNNAIALTGSNSTLEGLGRNIWCTLSYCIAPVDVSTAVSKADIIITASGYTPHTFTVRAGEPVTINLKNEDSNNCAQAFTIPQLGVKKVVPMGTSQIVSFTAPQTPGPIAYMCSMGMYRGTINVI